MSICGVLWVKIKGKRKLNCQRQKKKGEKICGKNSKKSTNCKDCKKNSKKREEIRRG